MKYAVISDVHGNAPALRLVLEDAHQQGAQGYLLAGDYCISAPWPNECVSLLRALPTCRAIRGNNDAMYVFPHDDSGQYEVARWCRAVLQNDHRSWLDALPPDLSFTCEGVHVRMAHSSEAFVGKTMHASFRSGMLPLRYPRAPVSRERLLADFRSLPVQDGHFRECVYALEPGVYIFGHNHIQCHADFDGRLLINPGSCGDPLDCGDPGVPYTLRPSKTGAARWRSAASPGMRRPPLPWSSRAISTAAPGSGARSCLPPGAPAGKKREVSCVSARHMPGV